MAISSTRGTGLVLALLLSVLLHCVLLSVWPSPRIGPRPPALAAERSLSLSLAVARPRATAPDTNRAQRPEAPAPRERFREGGAPRTALSRSWLDESRWLGGRLETFVNIGGRCFNVIAADPLDSLSFEQWFPVKCPR